MKFYVINHDYDHYDVNIFIHQKIGTLVEGIVSGKINLLSVMFSSVEITKVYSTSVTMLILNFSSMITIAKYISIIVCTQLYSTTVDSRTVIFSVCGPLEADPEYQLIVEANNVTVEIDNEISKFCYSCCFLWFLPCTAKLA